MIEAPRFSGRLCLYALGAGLGLLGACAPAEDASDNGVVIEAADAGGIDGGASVDLDARGALGSCSLPGCACEPGSAPKSCYPDPVFSENGTKVCAQGTMSCRSGTWTGCETLVNYDLRALSNRTDVRLGVITSALVSDASTCNVCNPDCFIATTAPVASDLTATNSSNVDYNPTEGGITLHVLVNGTQRGSGSATAICGNGVYENGINGGVEECDDGNIATLDGCDNNCRLEKSQDWFCPTPGSPCRVSSCGNGVVEGSEPCDDGENGIIGDGCGRNCVAEPSCAVGAPCESSCGDGIRLASDLDEQCDDGNPRSNDGCSSTCKIEPGYTCTDVTGTLPASFPLTVTYRDFIAFPTNGSTRHPDFEGNVGAALGLVKSTLVGGKPDYSGICEAGKPLAASCNNVALTTSAARFNQWYANAEISGVMKKYVSTMNMARQGTTTAYKNTPLNSQLFPLDSLGFVAGSGTAIKELKSNNHNFAFTSEIRHWFQFKGGEVLTFSGDDDVWVFIGGKLALDIGGVHGAIARTIRLNADGSVSCFEGSAASGTACNPSSRSLGLVVNSVYEMALFHAERHTTQSNFDLTLNGFVATKSQCLPFCGNGVITTDEFCDDGTALNGLAGQCFSDCSGRASKYVTSASYHRDYTAVGTCRIPPERPLWGNLTWTGNNSAGGTISFKLQGAETSAGLATAASVTVTTSTTSTGGSFDVRTALAGAGLQADVPYLRVTALLTSSADQKNTPVLRSFDVAHTCVNAQ